MLFVQVVNNGEDAYSSLLQVDLPEDIHLVKIHQKEEVTLACQAMTV